MTSNVFDKITVAKHVCVYHKQPLPKKLLKSLGDVVWASSGTTVEIVAEDIGDIGYLRALHSSGFKLFYGVGLPQLRSFSQMLARDFSKTNRISRPSSAVYRLNTPKGSITGFAGADSATRS
jgi:hypothetical protein